jgi:hypothetical protein
MSAAVAPSAAVNPARALWLRLETIHAVTYFGGETTAAGDALGLSGFWMGYFGFRAAPLGRVSSGVVEATFCNFAGAFVERWVPAVWDVASPEALVAARVEAAAGSLRHHAHAEATAENVIEDLTAAVGRCTVAGRPLFGANRGLASPSDPVQLLWHLCTCLREHRGDGHVAALTAAGLSGLEAHVLIALEQGNSQEDLQRARGWAAADWDAAVGTCVDRGLVAAGVLTPAGTALRAEVEDITDRLALAPFEALSPPAVASLIAALDPLARAVSSSGVIRYPNPMGLPPID